ncbi:ArsR/SmtB family transcription factor [Actinokineospora sp. 24-640]
MAVSPAALTWDQAQDASATFKALAHPIRLLIVALIARSPGGEACVCAIAEAFEVSGPTVSHHLKTLREAGVLTSRRRGTWLFYRVVPDSLDSVIAVLPPVGPPIQDLRWE